MRARNFFLFFLAGLLGLWFWASRKNDNRQGVSRPNDPWVFRSVLDLQPRMITFALDDHCWAAYSTDSCALYKVWDGGVDFSGAVYNTQHGPQPMSLGNAWFENKYRSPWRVDLNGKTEIPSADYKGHRYTKNGRAELMYDLVLSDGRRIRVNERPEYVERDRQPGFERTFTVENAPPGAEVRLLTNLSSMADGARVETDGVWKTTRTTRLDNEIGLQTMNTEGELTLRSGKPTRMTAMFVHTALIANPFDAERLVDAETTINVSPGERLMAKSDCRTCHNPTSQTVGPSWVQVAERYKNIPANLEKLAEKVRKGGAGVWGQAAMSAHPDLMPEDAKTMLTYILSMDDGEDDGEGGATTDLSVLPAGEWLEPDATVGESDVAPGLFVKAFTLEQAPQKLADVDYDAAPLAVVLAPDVNASAEDFGPLQNNFALEYSGYLFLEKDDNILLEIAADDGVQVTLDEKPLLEHDGWHGMDPRQAEVALRAGFHPLRIRYFQAGGGRGIRLRWARFSNPVLQVVPAQNFVRKRVDAATATMGAGSGPVIPGDGGALREVHPAYTLSQARPDEFLPKTAGMDFLPDGRLLVSTWDAAGAVYLLDGVQSGDPKKIKVKRIAQGLAEPLGLKVVDGDIYVLQKQELTKLVDTDGDEVIDEYQCFAKGWRASANFHEFAFGLAYKDDHFYAALAIAILPGGASARPQIPDRGKVVRISRKDGSIEFVARGLRTPNGISTGPDGELFVADNQGDWLPASKILHVKPGAFYNSYAVDSLAVAALPVQPPVAWLPQDEIGNSPTQPALLDDGPYKNQLIHGDVCYGGLQRVFMEKINGDYQGCVFKFSQGFEGGTNRIAKGSDGAFYIGCIGNPGNWGQEGKYWYGLQRMAYNGASVFEMLAVRAKTNGLEIEFTEPLRENDGWDPAHYAVQQWRYQPTVNYGGPKIDLSAMTVQSATVSADRRKVFLDIPGLKAGHVVYLHLKNLPLSELGHEIWTTDAWYTLNAIPQNNAGETLPRPAFTPLADNTLSENEKRAGWRLLFDGKSTAGWRAYGKNEIGGAWRVEEGALYFAPKTNSSGGDIVSAEEYRDFELKLDWKIGECGNSGILYNVVENPAKYEAPWMTGLEMQILDNNCHPDGRITTHRAGDLYDLIRCKYETVKPAGQWNHIRIVSKNGRVEHWLNHRKLVEFQMFTPDWNKMIAGSKFKAWPDFGQARKGRLALQDHGDAVWYKNIKIRDL